MRCVIVTGVSRGLGAALARVLLGREAVVLGVGRSSAADLQGERYRFVQCDLADVPGIRTRTFCALRGPISSTPTRLYADGVPGDS